MSDTAAHPIDADRVPGEGMRWRCGGCGNLTRFDVVRTARMQEFWHVGLGGEPRVEESTILAETVESVTCRWCGRSDAIELVERPDAVGP
jgi:ribosomal protein S27E